MPELTHNGSLNSTQFTNKTIGQFLKLPLTYATEMHLHSQIAAGGQLETGSGCPTTATTTTTSQ